MTIEVRQMLIKSTVLQGKGMGKDSNDQSMNLEDIKEHIMEECRQMLIEMLRQKEER